MTRAATRLADTRRTLRVGPDEYTYYSLREAERALGDLSRLPFSLKILLENLLRHEDGDTVAREDLDSLATWLARGGRCDRELAFRPARVLMQDFTGVPAVADLAAMREAYAALGGAPERINPRIPVDLVIDHSVAADVAGSSGAFGRNAALEFARNGERYEFLRFGQQAFRNFRVVPPGTGICHQVNLEFLARVVWTAEGGRGGGRIAYPDTVAGTDSHTTMVNGLGVLGWGVGGIEAEAAMLGQPISMTLPEVVGVELTGALPEGATAADLVLTVTQLLRARGVVGKFVEFFGDGLDGLPLPDRATLANMAPEYGATCGFFPVDGETLRYLRFTGRSAAAVDLVEAYAKAQGMWREPGSHPLFTETVRLPLGSVEPSVAGPKRPQDRIRLADAARSFAPLDRGRAFPLAGSDRPLSDGDIVIAAITSCTHTSNPSALVAAGLLAKRARARGLSARPWVKTSFAPGSQVVPDYLAAAGLLAPLEELGFHVVGFGCTSCIGNSGPLPGPVAEAVAEGELAVASVLSGNRNFEGRIHPHVKANYLASPPLVVAYALAGTIRTDLSRDPLGRDAAGREVFLRDLWPDAAEVASTVAACLSPEMFARRYADVFAGTPEWRRIAPSPGETYRFDPASTYLRRPPFFAGMGRLPEPPADIVGARCLALLGDSITTDHISPAGRVEAGSPAARHLAALGVPPEEFNAYGTRRGNHEVMMRGTFAHPRLRNEMLGGVEGGLTLHVPTMERMSVFDAAMRYAAEGTPLVVIAGAEYGAGSSRDWAAKGPKLLGVRAVVAAGFERIHRSNLLGMGILPLEFAARTDRRTLGLTGLETFELRGVADLRPRAALTLAFRRADGSSGEASVTCRIDTANELRYFKNGGILPHVLRDLLREAETEANG